MYLHALATAVPPATYTQPECWGLIEQSPARLRLSRRATLTLRAVLKGASGVATRHFAVPDIAAVFDLDADQLNAAFRAEAPRLAARALAAALASVAAAPAEIDALLICTCTGYLCPGVTSYVAEQLGLRTNTWLQDLVGLGCGAAIPTLRAAEAVLAAKPDALVACVAVEVCSAAFYLDDDPGVLISACLFSDGAAATLWRATPAAGTAPLRCHGFSTVHQPGNRDRIRFEQRNGKLRNLLDPAVPQLAAAAVSGLLAGEQTRPGARPIARIIAHPGGRDVLDALEGALPGYSLDASRRVLSACGNMSSPSVLFALEQALTTGRPDEGSDWWMVSFGAGFSAHGCRVGVI
jgi:alkylresorcinol/alkylpyrone synthase